MILFGDSSALVKRYLAESGSEDVARWVAAADATICCRVGYTEMYRAISVALAAQVDQPLQVAVPDGPRHPADGRLLEALAALDHDWQQISVVEVNDALARRAGVLAAGLGLRSLDALHLAAAELVAGDDMRLATWDRRLWRAARTLGMSVLPQDEP